MRTSPFILAGVLAVFAGDSPAAEVELRGKQIMLTGVSCSRAKAEIAALSSWTDSTGGRACDAKVSTLPGGGCEADITGCVPDHVRKYQGVHPELGGPNCYNFALVYKGLSVFPRRGDRCLSRFGPMPAAARGRASPNRGRRGHALARVP